MITLPEGIDRLDPPMHATGDLLLSLLLWNIYLRPAPGNELRVETSGVTPSWAWTECSTVLQIVIK